MKSVTNMAQPDNRIFSYPLPILTWVLHKGLIITNSKSNFIKYTNKLIHNQAPVVNWLCPFLLNLHQREIYSLLHCIIWREWELWFSVLSNLSVKVLNKIGRVDNIPYLKRELEENGKYSEQSIKEARVARFTLDLFSTSNPK